jgi:hypothetical protein
MLRPAVSDYFGGRRQPQQGHQLNLSDPELVDAEDEKKLSVMARVGGGNRWR